MTLPIDAAIKEIQALLDACYDQFSGISSLQITRLKSKGGIEPWERK